MEGKVMRCRVPLRVVESGEVHRDFLRQHRTSDYCRLRCKNFQSCRSHKKLTTQLSFRLAHPDYDLCSVGEAVDRFIDTTSRLFVKTLTFDR
jgi:hypothetical protein